MHNKFDGERTCEPGRRAQRKRQNLDARAFRAILVGYADTQNSWLALDCAPNRVVASIHVSFDETESDAAAGLKRIEFTKLAQCTSTTFGYYSKTATSIQDMLFYSPLPAAEKPRGSEAVLLEDFVAEFDLQSLDTAATAAALAAYAPDAAPWLRTLPDQQALTSSHPLLRITRAQKQAELLVALENLSAKHAVAATASHRLGADPVSYAKAMRRPDAALWRAVTESEGESLRANSTWVLVPRPHDKRVLPCKWVFKLKH